MDQLSRTIKVQIIVFVAIALVSSVLVGLNYIRLPEMLFGIGQYKVTVELPTSGDLYASGNVTYRGTEVGRVTDVRLTDTGVEAVLSLRSDVRIPADLRAEVHSQTAVGEQYVALIPNSGDGPPLRNGDVIPLSKTSVPPNINSLLDATNKGLQAIPNDNVRTVIDEGYTALGGLGPELGRFVDGSTSLAIGAQKHLDDLTALVDGAQPVLDSQTNSRNAVEQWAANLAAITSQLHSQDYAVRNIIQQGGPAANEGRQLLERIRPTLPVILANLVSLGQVGITYQPNIEQLLVLLPQGVAEVQGTSLTNRNTKQDYAGLFLSFNLNLNLPPPCTTGFLPAQQVRPPTFEDAPDRPAGDVYCRVPQDSMWHTRGVRNTPCEGKPWKRAPTVAMCESDENYVPLNDGQSWKGDPNATWTGQAVPQLPPGTAPTEAPPPAVQPEPTPIPALAIAEYDPATGTYLAPDGKVYTQSNLPQGKGHNTWQSMLLPSG